MGPACRRRPGGVLQRLPVASTQAGRVCRPPGFTGRQGYQTRSSKKKLGGGTATVDIRNVRKAFGSVEVLHGVSVDIADSEFVVLVGPPGCGKSTLLRMIAGLENISAGEIAIGKRVVNTLPPKDRDVAMVFQNYALYPHMTVFDNMALSMKLANAPAAVMERLPPVEREEDRTGGDSEGAHLRRRLPVGGADGRLADGLAAGRDLLFLLRRLLRLLAHGRRKGIVAARRQFDGGTRLSAHVCRAKP